MTSLALVAEPNAPASPRALELLARVDDLRQDLERPDLDVADVVNLHSRAEVLAAAARAAHLGLDVANQAAEVKLRAERRCGAMLRQLVAAAGPWKRHPTVRSETPRRREHLPRGTLAALGVSGKDSSAWQLIARLSESEFEQRVRAIKDAGRQIHTGNFVRAARQFARPVSGRPTTPAASLLRRALRLLKEVRVITTQVEVDLAREVVTLGESWSLIVNPPPPVSPRAVAREVSCLLCGRPRPPSRPPTCPSCGGRWLEA